MEKKYHAATDCPVTAAIDVIGGKWKGLILWGLRLEPHRFGELRRLVPGISEKMLIQHLKEMEADGIRPAGGGAVRKSAAMRKPASC